MPIALSLFACPFDGLAQEENELKGDGTRESPFIIEEPFDLGLLRQRINNNEFYTEGKYVQLNCDIHLNSDVIDAEGKLSADSLSFNVWEPIGKDSYGKSFYGIFDGNGHTIYGLYINDRSAKNSGLFGYIAKDAIVKNLNVADGYICGGVATGGIVGLCKGSIINCKNYMTVKSAGPTHQGGGITGQIYEGMISGCENHGLILGETYSNEWGEAWNCYTGGIAGEVRARVDSCVNKGKVIAYGWGPVGGIAGTIGQSYISNSINEGYVTSNYHDYIGGIVGCNSSSISGCINKGTLEAQAPGSCIGGISGVNNYNHIVRSSENHADIICDVDSVFVGGIVGRLDGGRSYDTYYTPKVYTSRNYGTISTTSAKSQCGGIVGLCYCGEIYECHNFGHIVSYSMAGGILPLGEFHSHVYDSSNSGKVEGLKSAGGIVGKTNGEVGNCFNSGAISNIDANNNCGGLVGWLSGSSGIVRNCINTGSVGDGRNVGGIAGNNEYNSSIISSYNAGYVFSSTVGSRIGGVAGGAGTLRNCYNAGPVHAMGENMIVGGLTQNVWASWDSHGNRSGSSMSNCYNVGDIIVDHDCCTVGNLAATYEPLNDFALFNNCFYIKDAIYGAVAENDEGNSRITALGRDGFRTLADNLNSNTDYFEAKPYVQGTWRPLLIKNGYYEDPIEPMGYYELTSLDGDSVKVDLGLPMENVYIDNEKATAPTEGYNFVSGNKCLRSKLVDASDFNILKDIDIEDFYYVRSVESSYDTACLPFRVEQEDLKGTEIGTVDGLRDGTLFLTKSKDVEACCPFVIRSEVPTVMYASRRSLTLSPSVPAADGVLAGTFENLSDLAPDSYILDNINGLFVHAEEGAGLGSFRGYLGNLSDDYESISISFDSDPSGVVAAYALEPIIYVNGLTLVINHLVSGSIVNVFSLDGKAISRVKTQGDNCCVTLPDAGIYVVRIGDYTGKVMVP